MAEQSNKFLYVVLSWMVSLSIFFVLLGYIGNNIHYVNENYLITYPFLTCLFVISIMILLKTALVTGLFINQLGSRVEFPYSLKQIMKSDAQISDKQLFNVDKMNKGIYEGLRKEIEKNKNNGNGK